jgi:hypothetical protein
VFNSRGSRATAVLRADWVRPMEVALNTSDYAYPSEQFCALQSALTSRICSIVEQDVSTGDATMTARHRAREIATFRRFRE